MSNFKLVVDTSQMKALFSELDKLVGKINTTVAILDKKVFQQVTDSIKGLENSTESISKDFGEIKKETKAIAKEIENIKDSSGKVTTMWARITFVATALVSYKIFDILGQGISSAKDESVLLEKSFVELKSLMNDLPNGDKIAKIFTEQEVDLAVKYGHSLKDITEGAYNTVSALNKNKDSLIALDNAMKLAEVTSSSTTTTTKLINRTLNAFNMEVSQSSRIAETWFKVIQEGDIRLEDMGGSIGKLIASAGAAGITFEQVASAYGLMVKVLPAKQATTALTRIINKFTEMPEVLKRVQEVGLLETIKEFNDLSGKQLKAIVGSSKAISGMNIIFQKSADTQKIYNKMLSDTSYLEKAFAEFMGTETKKRDVLLEKTKANIRRTGSSINWLLKIGLEASEGLTTAFGGISIAIAGVTAVVWKLVTAYKALGVAGAKLSSTNILGLVLMAGVTFGVAIHKIGELLDESKKKIDNVSSSINNTIKGVSSENKIAQQFNDISTSITRSQLKLKEYQKLLDSGKYKTVGDASYGIPDRLTPEGMKIQELMDKESKSLEEQETKYRELATAYNVYNTLQKNGKVTLEEFTAILKSANVSVSDSTKYFNLFTKQVKTDNIKSVRETIQGLVEKLSLLKLEVKFGTKTTADYKSSLEGLETEYGKLKESTTLTMEEEKELIKIKTKIKDLDEAEIVKKVNLATAEGNALLSKNKDIQAKAGISKEKLIAEIENEIEEVNKSNMGEVKKIRLTKQLINLKEKLNHQTSEYSTLVTKGNEILSNKSNFIGENNVKLTEYQATLATAINTLNDKLTRSDKEILQLTKLRKIQDSLNKAVANGNAIYYQAQIILSGDTVAIENAGISRKELIKNIEDEIIKKEELIKKNSKSTIEVAKLANEIVRLKNVKNKLSESSPLQNFFNFFSQALQSVQSMIGSFYEYFENKARNTYDKLIANNERLKQSEIDRIKNSTLSEEQRRKALQSINDKYDEKNKKARDKMDKKLAKQKKHQAIYDSTINYAQGIIKIWSNKAIEPIYAKILTGLLTGVYMAQMTVINKTKYADGGILKGASHSNGGISINANEEVEGDEVILTKGVTSSPVLLAMASFINKLAGGADFANSSSGFTAPIVESSDASSVILEYLQNFRPVVLTGITDRGIYRAYESGKPQGAF